MKFDKFVPMSDKPEVTPAANPPTILPRNEPIPYPTASKTPSPRLRKSSNPGISSAKPATATAKAVTPATSIAKVERPFDAAAPRVPTPLRINKEPDSESNTTDKPAAIPNTESTSNWERATRIPPKALTTNVITPNDIYAFEDIVFAWLIVINEAENASNKTDNPSATVNVESTGKSANK